MASRIQIPPLLLRLFVPTRTFIPRRCRIHCDRKSEKRANMSYAAVAAHNAPPASEQVSLDWFFRDRFSLTTNSLIPTQPCGQQSSHIWRRSQTTRPKSMSLLQTSNPSLRQQRRSKTYQQNQPPCPFLEAFPVTRLQALQSPRNVQRGKMPLPRRRDMSTK